MRIDDLNVSAGTPARAGAVETTSVQLSGSKAARATESGVGRDSVELSDLSRVLQASASGREERLQSLSSQVKGGTYTVDPNAVSRAIVQETLASHSAGANA